MNYNNQLHYKIKSNKKYITIKKSNSKFLSWNELREKKLYDIHYKLLNS